MQPPTGENARPPADEGERRFATILPPTRFDARIARGSRRATSTGPEFHEHLLETAFVRFGQALSAAGIDGLPTLPTTCRLGQEATPLNAARTSPDRSIWWELDYYQVAKPRRARAIVARRTSELAVRTESLALPAFASRDGRRPFPLLPPPSWSATAPSSRSRRSPTASRGYNVYMAVERDRWIGAPIDPHGRPRPFAAFWRKLSAALVRTSFFTLTRRTPVRVLTPRTERRLARVMHAFGADHRRVLLGGRQGVPGTSVSEQDLGLGYPLGIASDSFARTLEAALESRGAPFACIGGEDRDVSLDGARWIVCSTSGGLNPALFRRLAEKAAEGVRVTLGPHEPAFDGAYRPLAEPLDLGLLHGSDASVPVLLHDDPAAADAAVSRGLGRSTGRTDLAAIRRLLRHRRTTRRPRSSIVINPGEGDVVEPSNPSAFRDRAARAVDVLDDSVFDVERSALEVRMTPRTVRMLALG